jgi:DUF1009 family protein
MGFRVAEAVGRLDIGQCIVVGGGSVLAVEAVEGTDAAIERGGALGRGHAVAVKACKPQQDRRFDLPAVGAGTIRAMIRAKVRVLAVEAGSAVVFEREEMIRLAEENGIAVLAVARPPGKAAADG